MEFLEHPHLIKILIAAFLAILFLQSGIDKVVDWKGNLGWLKGHFSQTFLKNQVPFLLATVTLTEIASGALSLLGIFQIITNLKSSWAYWGAVLSMLSLMMLFLGQRIAKDYAGAGNLVPYFLLALVASLLLK
ncbi:MAG: DoxX family protein [Thermonemataceae bacterium]|nr:DoxX family protein [Thermonemataceae bacterium]